jgi:hypothetical protein
LLRLNNTPKPAYYAYRDAARSLGCWVGGAGSRRWRFSAGDDLVGMTARELLRASRRSQERALRAQSTLGVRWLRQVFDRRSVMARRGPVRIWHYARLVMAAAKTGMSVVPVLYDSSRRRAGRRARLAAMAAFLVRRYGPDGRLWRERQDIPKVPIRSWQVWREPNLARSWGGRPSSRAYAALLKAVNRRVKRLDPGAEIITGSLSYARGAVPPRLFVAHLYGAWARRSFDALAIDPYASGPAGLLRRARAMRRLMLRAGDRAANLWITSFGWSDKGRRGRLRASRRRQASLIRHALVLLARDRRTLGLRGVGYVTWRDGPAGDRPSWQGHAGLLDARGRRKPAYRSFRAVAQALR